MQWLNQIDKSNDVLPKVANEVEDSTKNKPVELQNLLQQEEMLNSNQRNFQTEETIGESKEVFERFRYLEEKFSRSQLIRMISDISVIILRGTYNGLTNIHHSAFMTLGYFFLSRSSSTSQMAALAVYSMIYASIWMSYCYAIQSMLTISASQAFSIPSTIHNGKRYLSQSLLFFLVYSFAFYVPFIVFIPQIFGILGITEDISLHLQSLYFKMVLFDLIDGLGMIFQGYCNAQIIEDLFSHIAWLVFIPMALFNFFCYSYWDIGMNGWIICFNAYKVIGFLSITYVFYFKSNPKLRGICELKELLTGLGGFTKEALSIWVSNLFEFISMNIATFFVTLGGDAAQIAAMGAIMNVISMNYMVGLGFLLIGRNRVNYLLGDKMALASKKMFFITIVSEGIIALITGILLFLLRFHIAMFYAGENIQTIEYLSKILALYALFIQIDIHYSIVTAICRSLNHVMFTAVVFAIFSVIINGAVCTVLYFYFKADCTIIFSGTLTCYCASVIINFYKISVMDWKNETLLCNSLNS